MKIMPLTGSLGAEITGIDLRNLSSEAFSAVEDAFARYLVLCFRDQQLTPDDLLRVTHRFGGPGETPYLTGLPECPDVVPIIKEPDERSPYTFGAGWHTDFTFQAHPPSRTLLYAVDTPKEGGDTLYANLFDACAALSPAMRNLLAGMRAVHSAVRSYGPAATLRDHLENMKIVNDERDPETVLHPVIRRHPVSGRDALWVNPTYTIRFENMTEEESTPLLDFLNALAVSPSYCCRVRWEPGTLTMWDNRCTQHCATSDYQGHRRECWRTTVKGEIPLCVEVA